MKTAKEIEMEIGYGECFKTAEFAELVRSGSLIPYDGLGYYHNGENETDIPASFDYNSVLRASEEYPYVCWYNK